MQQVAPDDATRCNRIKPADAARALGINRSSLKRYFDQYPELLAGGLVDLDELKRHRADNPRIADERGAESGAKPPAPASHSRKGSKGRLEEVKLWEAEADWALKIGQLVDPTRSADEALDAVAALRDKLMAPEHTLCERLAEERDPLAVKQILREHNRASLEELRQSFERIFTGRPADEGHAQP